VIVAALVSAWFVRDSVLYEHTDDAQIDGHIMPLSARISGHVERINVEEGQLVHAGEILAVIDQKEYNIALYRALANVAYAEATTASLYFNAAITVTSAYGGLNSAQAAVKSAQAEVVAAVQKLQNDQAVLEQFQIAARTDSDILREEQYNSAPMTPREKQAAVNLIEAVVAADQQELQQAQGTLLQATTILRNAQTAPQQVGIAKANAQAGDSQIMDRKAQLDQAQLNLSYTIIRSPITGVVGKRHVDVGQTVSVGQDLIDVVSQDDVWITANFKETQIAHLSLGQPVEIRVDAYGRKWKGHVTNLGGGAGSVFSIISPDSEIGKYVKGVARVPVRIDFDRAESKDFNAEDLLKPGLSVETEVRVRWLPRNQRPNSVPATQASIPGPTAF
jgi:membrane fusion protein (multidrug efflux system)